MLIRISVCNRGPDAAPLHVLPTLWFRNTWSQAGGGSKPALKQVEFAGHAVVHAHHSDPLFQESLADYFLYCDADVPLLFTENETNNARLFGSDQRLTLREGRHPQLHRSRRRDRGKSGARRNEGGGPLPGYRRRREDAGHPAAADDARARSVGPAVRRLRRGVRGTPERGRCVLRLDHAARGSQRPGPRERHAPGAGGHAVDQAVLLLRPRPLARRAWCREPLAATRAPARAQQRVGPHVQRRHHLDAGQVGIPLVRRVGSGVPHDSAGHGRSRLRQAAARPDAAQRLPASERPAASLRVELRRRESARCMRGRRCSST